MLSAKQWINDLETLYPTDHDFHLPCELPVCSLVCKLSKYVQFVAKGFPPDRLILVNAHNFYLQKGVDS